LLSIERLRCKLDDDIHGLAHITQLNLGKTEKINDLFKTGEEKDFEILSISPAEHRLALQLVKAGAKKTKEAKEEREEKTEVKKTKTKKEKTELEEDKVEEEAAS